MACLLLAPMHGARGVISFTTQERDQLINISADLRQSVAALKSRWVVGLHHNWHDYAFKYDDLFDFSMAGEGDLREVEGRAFNLIQLDACNFAPACFRPGTDKHWDILAVSRAVKFKGVFEFIEAVRKMYDEGQDYRVLLVCPVSNTADDVTEWSVAKIRAEHERLFSEPERKRFTILTLEFDYPFPLDLETLSVFYKASRVFVHMAPDERRVRTAGYAWASGLPVIGAAGVGSLLPEPLRRPPYFFDRAKLDFAEGVRQGLHFSGADFSLARNAVSESETKKTLQAELFSIFMRMRIAPNNGPLAGEGFDIRLGRHHGLSTGANRIDQALEAFVAYLRSAPDEELARDSQQGDCERAIAQRAKVPLVQ